MTSRWLDENEDRAWRSYRRMFTLLEGETARELADASGLSMADYTVLSNLVEAAGRRCRLTELAEQMQWSQSRLSHHITRMEKRGLVRRESAPTDGRGIVVTLTRKGLKAIAQATPHHMASVRAHFADVLSHDQLAALADIAETVVDHLTGEAD